MGKAAYERGSAVIRRQIAEDFDALPKRHPAEIALHHAERINGNLKARIESLEAELERARRYMSLARLERDATKEDVAKEKKRSERWKQMCRSVMERASKMERSWRKASALLRMLPADLVREARETGDHRV